MSVKKIIQESIDKNPLGVKEALEEALQDRVRAALEEKYKKMAMKEEDDEDDEDDEDEDDEDMKESFDLSDYTLEELENFMVSEDFDQLDEISQEKLRDYHAKAGADRQKAKATVQKTMNTKAPYVSSVNKASDAYKRFQKRGAGMTMAANKMKD